MLKAYLKIIAVILVTVISCTAILSTLFAADGTDVTNDVYINNYDSQYNNATQNTPDTEVEEETDIPLLEELMRVQEFSKGCYI